MAEPAVPQIRKRKVRVLQVVENLDAFPKVPETCEKRTSYGGSASLTAIFLILWLSILEIGYYMDSDYTFHFSPDIDMDSKLSINVDMVVAMPCSNIGADIVDSTNQNLVKFGELEEEYVHFALGEGQKAYFRAKSGFNSYLREEYHSLHQILWKNSFLNSHAEMPPMTKQENREHGIKEACRLHGRLELNKVAGNFHVTVGKTLPLPRGHAHIAAFMTERDYNFSHRISKFFFGEGTPGIVLPLEGDEKIAPVNQMVYHYFIQVVPTIVKTRFKSYLTYQYSVRELAREINHDQGSHGVSGIFFKYEMSGLKVEVTEESEPFLEFIVRLCAIIGGVYATIGMIYNHMSFFGCKMNWIKDEREESKVPLSEGIQIGNNSEASSKSNKGKGQIQNPILSPVYQTPTVQLVQTQNESQRQFRVEGQVSQGQFQIEEEHVESAHKITLSDSSANQGQHNPNEGLVLPDLLSSHSKP